MPMPRDDFRFLLEQIEVGQTSPLQAQRVMRRLARRFNEPTVHEQADYYHPPARGNWVLPLVAPDRVFVVEDIPLVLQASETPAGVRLEFSSGPVWLLGMRGSIVGKAPDDAAMTEVSLRMVINDGEDIITNGNTSDFALYSDLFPPSGNGAGWFPIMRHFGTKDVLNMYWRNTSATADYQPSLMFPAAREAIWGGDIRSER